MISIRLALIFWFFLLGNSFSQADKVLLSSAHPIGLETVFGIVEEINLNSIEIYNKNDKCLKIFVNVSNMDGFHKGDRVRIDYWVTGNVVEHIKKMSSLEYKEKGQNLGYILKEKGKHERLP